MDNYNVAQPTIRPQQPQAVQQQTTNGVTSTAQTQPASAQQGSPTAAGVNIIIQNPTVNPAPSMPCYPSNYYTQSPIYNVAPPNAYQQQPQAAAPVSQEPVAQTPIKKEEPEEKKTQKTKDVVKLTDDYIKSLEGQLRSQNRRDRQFGAKELIKRFQEDDSRKNDAALNSLLNLTLQDPYSEIRMTGISALTSGIAQGDNNTVKILQNMQKSDGTYGEDALNANEALLKMSEEKVKIPDNSPEKPTKSESKEEK